ncbi:dihydrofolate reductase family protein [Sphingobacterium suaedae]|uniref:Dihydrofolate reductase family protein n=1 Tax=Sphingobacterium suaedae TaxID=1686402 RepID=A0ABW5KEW2_9SPHI
MRKLIIQEFVSVDGFVADRNKTTAFFDSNPLIDADVNQELLKFIHTLDTIVLGRNTYEMFVDFWPNTSNEEQIVADDLNRLPKFVFSKSLQEVHWGTWDNAILVSSDAIDYVKELKADHGKDIVVWGSISLTQSLLRAGLVDQIRLFICPIAIGQGYHLFPDEFDLFSLHLEQSISYKNGVVQLVYTI